MAAFCVDCGTRLEQSLAFGQLRSVCPNCGHVHFDDPKVAVGVVVTLDGRIVLGKRGHEPKMGLWSFPSGFADAGEVLEDAARREVEEETGLKTQLERLLGVFSTAGERVIFVAYTGVAIGGELSAGEECIEVGAFPPDALPELAFPHDNAIIAAWAAGEGMPLPADRQTSSSERPA